MAEYVIKFSNGTYSYSKWDEDLTDRKNAVRFNTRGDAMVHLAALYESEQIRDATILRVRKVAPKPDAWIIKDGNATSATIDADRAMKFEQAGYEVVPLVRMKVKKS